DCIRDFHVTGVQTCALPILMKQIAWIKLSIFGAIFAVSGCGEEEARPEVLNKLRGIGVLTEPLVSKPSLTDAPSKVSLTIYASRSEERRVGKESRQLCEVSY